VTAGVEIDLGIVMTGATEDRLQKLLVREFLDVGIRVTVDAIEIRVDGGGEDFRIDVERDGDSTALRIEVRIVVTIQTRLIVGGEGRPATEKDRGQSQNRQGARASRSGNFGIESSGGRSWPAPLTALVAKLWIVVAGEEMGCLHSRRGCSPVAGWERASDEARRGEPLPKQRPVRYAGQAQVDVPEAERRGETVAGGGGRRFPSPRHRRVIRVIEVEKAESTCRPIEIGEAPVAGPPLSHRSRHAERRRASRVAVRRPA
jgi:hypothetical protein